MQHSFDDLNKLFESPFNDLLFKAHSIHRQYFDPNTIQASTLLSIKTGNCPEDCKYCSQSGHYETELENEKLLPLDQVLSKAKTAKASGATRFCMGAAWRSPPKKQLGAVLNMIKEVKKLGLETCVTLGMVDKKQAEELKQAGLDYYNHNIDTSPEYYQQIVSTRNFEDRINTLNNVRQAGIKVCSGGIISMGETRSDRINMLLQFTYLSEPPESIPINKLVPIPGTPLGDVTPIDAFEFVRTIAVTRIVFPKSVIRLSAGRENMSEELQSLCFFAGANSIFFGEKLLTTANPIIGKDQSLFNKLNIKWQDAVVEPN